MQLQRQAQQAQKTQAQQPGNKTDVREGDT